MLGRHELLGGRVLLGGCGLIPGQAASSPGPGFSSVNECVAPDLPLRLLHASHDICSLSFPCSPLLPPSPVLGLSPQGHSSQPSFPSPPASANGKQAGGKQVGSGAGPMSPPSPGSSHSPHCSVLWSSWSGDLQGPSPSSVDLSSLSRCQFCSLPQPGLHTVYVMGFGHCWGRPVEGGRG